MTGRPPDPNKHVPVMIRLRPADRDRVRLVLDPGETVSEFGRAAMMEEVERREADRDACG